MNDPGTTHSGPDQPPRAQARLDWARRMTGDAALQLQRASTDAGFRSYWRAQTADGSRIVMDSPPGKEDVRPWLRIRDLLDAGGVRVPQVLARDADAGFLLLEDLGSDTCLQVLDADNADRLFDATIGQLLRLQSIPCPDDLPRYDRALLTRELRLFDQWFLDRHLGIVLEPAETDALDRINRLLVDAALAQPQVLVHRDFMPRNLMPLAAGDPVDPDVALIDFQDAVCGPIAYDAVCLFKDAFVSWPEARVAGWLDRYHARAAEAGLPVPGIAQFRRDADWIGVHRHLKVLGIFARLRHRDGKAHYLDDAPRFLAYLDAVLPRYPELVPLHEIIRRRVQPHYAAPAPAPGTRP